MRVSARLRYALRGLVDLAFHGHHDDPIKLSDLARRQNVSTRFLEQIFQDLRRSGLVVGKRGTRGGYKLGMDPRELSVARVARALEPLLLDPPGELETKGLPGLADEVWQSSSSYLSDHLEGLSLAEIVRRGRDQGLRPETNDLMYFI